MTKGHVTPRATRNVASLSDITPGGTAVVTLAGSPNVGKSTLFNALTGSNVTVGNWPGTTVDVSRGMVTVKERRVMLVDLPGAYSLDPLSPEERLSTALLTGGDDGSMPDAVVVHVDASHAARSLYIVRELRERGMRLLVAVTMADIARDQGIEIDADALAVAIGAPVVVIDPRHRQGFIELEDVMLAVIDAPPPTPLPTTDSDDPFAIADERFAWIDSVVNAGVSGADGTHRSVSDRIDAVALSPVLGPLLFLAAMWLILQVTTRVATPLQDALSAFINGPVTDLAVRALTAVGLADTWVDGLVVHGLVAGVGMVLTFIPLMTIMLALIAILEDSGYLARAAVVADRIMRTIGLPGQAFLPLIVGFGCNVPAVAATRVLPGWGHRVITALLVPFTSCTPRMIIYVFIATIFFPGHAGTVVFVMYLVTIVFVVLVGWLLRKTVWRSLGNDPLVIDLPPYQLPTPRLAWSATWLRLQGFLRTVGGIIVFTVIGVWFFQALPVTGGHEFGRVPVQDSAYAAVAKAATPVLEPAGFGSWPTTGALIVGFLAKEAVISSWAQTYSLAAPDSADTPGNLGEAIMADFDRVSGGHPVPAAWAFLVFTLAYTSCIATVAVQRREVGWRWTAFGFVLQLTVAWVVAVLIFQIGSRL